MNKRLILSQSDVISTDELVRQLNKFLEPHGVKLERIGVSGIELEATSFWAMIDELRETEGSSVLIICDNADGPPDRAIDCCGEWTNWQDRRFEGGTMAECLRSAIEAYRAKKAIDAQGANN